MPGLASLHHSGSLIPLWVNVGGLTDCPRIVAVADHRSPIGTREANESAQAVAKHNLLAYVNCDILLFQDFRAATETTAARRGRFLMVGRRWDLDITTPLDFSDPALEMSLREQAARNGLQRAEMWIDYFVFPRNLYRDFPPLAIGRRYWDNWLIWKARDIRADVVDATPSVVAIHQNHDHAHHPQGVTGVLHSPESERNFKLAGGWKFR